MRLFEDFKIKFEKPDWSRSPELGLIDTILEQHPHLVGLLSEDFAVGKGPSVFVSLSVCTTPATRCEMP